ncbi:Cullin repeat-like-containing domain protein [Phakopsora pachyrhizi]|uniref:Cullin repeat-like-containing domain protein n=1 Tax=Phakopsora pachyrhizi TaxID=170000 RepID=A0AAV0APX1_PHAPC|nr:Cullin repeat-like-containing domain protein [Phakopsora pachyrhizi]
MAMASNPNQLPSAASLEDTWKFLKDGTHHIMTRLRDGMTFAKYMELYTVSYNYCTSSRMNSSGNATLQAASSSSRGGANLMGSDLYRCLQNYFLEHVKGIRQASDELHGEELLKYYSTEWDRFTLGQVTSTGCSPILIVTGSRGRRMRKQSKLTLAVLGLIENRGMGRQSILSLGLDESDTIRQNLDVYKESFEAPFIKETERYYRVESEAFIANTSVTEYMQKADEAQGGGRSSGCLSSSKLKKGSDFDLRDSFSKGTFRTVARRV